MFRVDPKTVTRWAKAGKLSAIRTLGGHRRYRESEVRALLQGQILAAHRGLTPVVVGNGPHADHELGRCGPLLFPGTAL
jgi:excisionase family DNA binding protein